MPGSHLARVLLCAGAALVSGAFVGCSAISAVPQGSCTDNQECRDAFGLQWTCDQGSGFCAEIEASPRCAAVYPEDLLTDPERYPGDTILFATLLDGEGDIQMIRSANLAIEQLRNNDLEGRRFGMINCSYGSDDDVERQTADAVAAARYVVDSFGVRAIIGPGTSSLAEAVYNEVTDEVLIVSPSATSDSLTFIDGTDKGPNNPGTFWRTAAPDSGIAQQMAEIMIGDGRQKVALIFKQGAYGDNLSALLNKSLGELGLSEPLIKVSYTNATSDLGPAMGMIGAIGDVDEIVFIADSNGDVVTFLADAATRSTNPESSFANAALMLGDAGFSEANVLGRLSPTVVSALIEPGRVRLVIPKSPSGEAFASFSTAYFAAFMESPANNGFTAESFDAAWLAIYGAAWSLPQEGAITPRGMAAGLHRISDPNAATILDINSTNWPQIRASFADGRAINVRGASGNLNYDSATEETTGESELFRIVSDGGLRYEKIE